MPRVSTREAQAPTSSDESTYGQILKSTSLIGGANGINYVIGLVRTKIIAVLLGPSGVGLIGVYVSISGMLSTLSGLGISSSGVRSIAEASGSGDEERMASTAQTLRRISWLTGLLGCLLSMILAWPLSHWSFGDGSHSMALAVLGISILFTAISAGQGALIQGMRRIGDLAKMQILGSLLGTVISIGIYVWLRERGIIPALVATAGIQLAISWIFTRKIPLVHSYHSWLDSLRQSRNLLTLGLAFMWSSLLSALVILGIRILIVRELGLEANGIYQAAWAISGMFAGFVLGAMGADFYPRLTAVEKDHNAVNRLVNEQTEVGILLALPGLIGTLTYSPWLMSMLYSEKFVQGSELLPWFVLGIFGQVISWPMGFMMLAKGTKGWYLFSETAANLFRMGIVAGLIYPMGLLGVAVASPILYVVYTLLMLSITRHLTGFRWSGTVLRLLCLSSILVGSAFAVSELLPIMLSIVLGTLMTMISCIFALHGLAQRIGPSHRLIQMALRIPGFRLVLGKSSIV